MTVYIKHKNVLSFFFSYIGKMHFGLFLILCRVLVVAPIPFVLKIIIDHSIPAGDTVAIFMLALISFGLLFLHFALGVAGIKEIGAVTVTMVHDLRSSVFKQIQGLSYNYLDSTSSGRLLSKYTSDTHKVLETLVMFSENVIPDLIYGGVTLIILVTLNWHLSVVMIGIIPIYYLFRIYFSKRLEEANEGVRSTQESLTGRANELIGSLRYLKTLGNDRFAQASVDTRSEKFSLAYRGMLVTSTVFWTSMYVLAQILSMFVVGGGAYLVIEGEMSVGTLVAYLSAMPILLVPINTLANFADAYYRGQVCFESLSELSNTDVQESTHGQIKLETLNGEITFENVSFYYPNKPDKRAIDSFCLKIKPGQSIALVGASGSGKTTIANMVLGLYTPTLGSIFIDNVPISTLCMSWFRSQCSVVQQETVLFTGSIKENIRFAREDASDEEVIRAAKLAYAEEFILNLPQGYDTNIGERGAGLSGGQKQRISIARALLRDPKILIFDEATSALDKESEDAVKLALENVAEGRTVITIAHRMNTIRNADYVVVLDHGRIIEQGSFNELLNKGSYIQRMMEVKLEEYEVI